MNKKRIERSLKKIAKKNGVSVEEVRKEIEAAISTGEGNPDPKMQAFWGSIPSKGDKPTPEEVIAHIAGIAKQKNKP